MVNYWLFIIDQKNWEIVKKINIIGSNNKNKIEKIIKNDILVIYVISPMKSITSIFEVISKSKNLNNLFIGGIFPHRLNIKPIKILEIPVKIKTLLYDLDFIKNKEKWYLHFLGVKGIRKLTKKDYNIIKSKFNKNI